MSRDFGDHVAGACETVPGAETQLLSVFRDGPTESAENAERPYLLVPHNSATNFPL